MRPVSVTHSCFGCERNSFVCISAFWRTDRSVARRRRRTWARVFCLLAEAPDAAAAQGAGELAWLAKQRAVFPSFAALRGALAKAARQRRKAAAQRRADAQQIAAVSLSSFVVLAVSCPPMDVVALFITRCMLRPHGGAIVSLQCHVLTVFT